jgi:hypothetical protein
MKTSGERASSNVTVSLSPAEIDVLNAYCAYKGWGRTELFRRLIRRLPQPKELSPEAAAFRRLQDALPKLED